ncbi:MAG: siphovirus Gp157 family protein [Lamprobacter sp.]|uniref:siphovirus Gp157 family protein n=1 Tax=Lamprobacter sp. TaxID=3100796 RepID=UPI002B2603E7|nr:siphovirus Gp157 family protein [Lamprobacter sp.]MEA3641750.1 siphovirus Gp157 family protein [Lamprobacter sp.]
MPASFTLYELSADYRRALDELTAIEDLPEEAIADTLEGLQGAFEDKALNVARYIRNLEAEVVAIDDARKRMEARAKSTANQAKRLKDYLRLELERTGIKPKAADLALSVQRNPPSVRIDDEARLPADYLETVTTTRARKKEILEALKVGQIIPGAAISQSTRLVIR